MAVTPTSINLCDTRPPAPAGESNVKWQASASRLDPNNPGGLLVRDVSAYIPTFVGDAGSGGDPGGVPAPAPGDAAAGKFLAADGLWRIPGPALGGGVAVIVRIPLTPSAPGNFTVAHGLGARLKVAFIDMTTGGDIWFQPARYDATDLLLIASDAGVTGYADCWLTAADAEVALAPSGPGNFSVAHGLGTAPALVLVQMTGAGDIWQQDPNADGTNVLLTASEAGVTGYAHCFKVIPTVLIITHVTLPLAPGADGAFTVAHGLGTIPKDVKIRMTSSGRIWQQPADDTNLNLVASEGGVTGYAEVWT